MFRSWAIVIVSAAIGGAAAAQPLTPPSTIAPVAVAPPTPAFKLGSIVTDRTGVPLGPIETIAGTASEPMVVIKIDGKLVGVPQSTVTLKDGNPISSQTRAEILATVRAPG